MEDMLLDQEDMLVDYLATRLEVVWMYRQHWEVRVWNAKCDAFVIEELPSLEQPGWCWRTRRYWNEPEKFGPYVEEFCEAWGIPF